MATVIRVIKYEGDEAEIRKALAISRPLGELHCKGYTLTVAEHYNDLPQLVEVAEDDVFRALAESRLKKLLGYMASNVKEGGWEEVEKLGGVAGWVGFDDALKFLDSMSDCNAGLMERVKSNG